MKQTTSIQKTETTMKENQEPRPMSRMNESFFVRRPAALDRQYAGSAVNTYNLQPVTIKREPAILNHTMFFMKRFLRRGGMFIAAFLFVNLFLMNGSFGQGSQTFTSNGTFTLPPGVTSITVEAWGGGSGGNRLDYGGGGGGAYSRIIINNPNNSYNVVIGKGGNAGNSGGNTTFGSVLTANGATGSSGGAASNGPGITSYKGGNGGGTGQTKGGGAAASSAGPGANGSGATGGIGVPPAGNGGNGGNGNDHNGTIYGGGGGSGGSGASGSGADGAVIVTWTCPASTISYSSSTFCKTVTSATVTLTGSTGGTFSSDAGLSINSSTGEINPSASTAGIYTVHYQIASGGNGCTAVDAVSTVTIGALPTASVTGQSDLKCYLSGDGSITISATGGTGPWSYSVDNGLSYTAPASSPYVYGGLAAGQYKIRVKDANGCESKSVQ